MKNPLSRRVRSLWGHTRRAGAQSQQTHMSRLKTSERLRRCWPSYPGSAAPAALPRARVQEADYQNNSLGSDFLKYSIPPLLPFCSSAVLVPFSFPFPKPIGSTGEHLNRSCCLRLCRLRSGSIGTRLRPGDLYRSDLPSCCSKLKAAAFFRKPLVNKLNCLQTIFWPHQLQYCGSTCASRSWTDSEIWTVMQ